MYHYIILKESQLWTINQCLRPVMVRPVVLYFNHNKGEEGESNEDDKAVVHPGYPMEDTNTLKAEHAKEYCREDPSQL